MRKKLSIYKYGLLVFGLTCLPVFAAGQDLGSSSSLFKSPNPKTAAPKKNAPKSAPKAKTAAPTTAGKAPPTAKTPPRSARTATAASRNVKVKPTGKGLSAEKTAVVKPNTETKPQLNNTAANAAIKNTETDEIFERAIEEGNASRDSRNYIKAEAAYLRAQSLKTRDSRAIYGLGNLYSDQQRWEEAERAYRMAIQLEPNTPEAYIALSYVLTQPIVGTNVADRYTEAEKMARRAIQLDSRNAFGYDQLGVALELRGVISDETVNSYQKAIELEPTFALAYAHLGRLLRKKGKTNESSAAYRNAIQYSTDVPTMIMVADVMQSQQKYIESEQLLRRALRDDAKNPTALFLLGRALTTRGSFDEAEKVLKKSAEVSPNNFVAFSLLGSMYARREKFDDAEKYLMKALRVVSSNEKKRLAMEFESVGDGYMRAGKNKDAGRVYRQAAALDAEKSDLREKISRTN